MSDPQTDTTTPSVTLTDHHDTITIQQSITNVTVVNPVVRDHAVSHRSAPRRHDDQQSPKPRTHSGPRQGDPGTPHNSPNSANPTIRPDISFAPDGDRITRYHAPDGATATYREDKQNGNAVTLTLQDANGILTTHGDRRGFELTRVDALGHTSSEQVTLDTYWKNPLQIGSVVDKINCPNIGLKGVNVIPVITADVTRDKLQQFAAAHPQLADTLNHVPLPATVSGGRQMTFSDAQIAPSEFRACPPNRQGLIRK